MFDRATVGERGASIAGALSRLFAGPLILAAHLGLVYGGHGFFCALAAPAGNARNYALAVAGVTILSLLALTLAVDAANLRRNIQQAARSPALSFIDRAMVALVILSGVGVLWISFAALFLAPCLPMR